MPLDGFHALTIWTGTGAFFVAAAGRHVDVHARQPRLCNCLDFQQPETSTPPCQLAPITENEPLESFDTISNAPSLPLLSSTQVSDETEDQ